MVIGQAPGRKVHESGIPWDDASGNRLREWMGISKEDFYDNAKIALIPMGFCYPGRGASGDLPPRPECAPTWHPAILDNMPNVQLTLLIGSFAQKYYLSEKAKKTLTETVRSFREYGGNIIPLPHPSPRNNIWLKKNAWFEKELITHITNQVQKVL